MRYRRCIPPSILTVLLCMTVLPALAGHAGVLDRETIESWLSEYNVPAIGIGIIQDSALSEYRVFGETRKGLPADQATLFRTASLTKPITAIVTLKLVELGKWRLDEPLAHYWVDPDIRDDPRHEILTTRHVLSHQSGLPNWRGSTRQGELFFEFVPGTEYRYSGEGFEYLRRALERKFDASLEELANALLFTPLDMQDTHYRWADGIDTSRFAFRHDGQGHIYKEDTQAETSAAAGVVTTIADYSRFGIHVMNHAGLSPELFSEMIRPHRKIKEDVDQGLGWEIIQNLGNNEYALLHEGGSNGVKTIVVLLPKSKRGIVVFTNGDEGDTVYSKVLKKYVEYGDDVFRKLRKMSYDPNEIETINIDGEILSEYFGAFYIESLDMTVTTSREGDKLKMISPYNTVLLEAKSETEFFSRDDDLIIEFVQAEEGNSKGFVMTFRGGDPELVRRIE